MNVAINIAPDQYTYAEKAVRATNVAFERLGNKRQISEIPDLLNLEGSVLSLPMHNDVLEMLVDQLEKLANNRAALTLARKVRKVAGLRGPIF